MAAVLRPSIQLTRTAKRRHGLQRIAEQRRFEKAPESGDMPGKPRLLRGADGARRPARLKPERVWPMPSHKPHDVLERGPCGQKRALRLAAQGAKARPRFLMPRLARIRALREIRHEKHVEMGEMIGDVLGGEDQVLQAGAVLGRRDPLRLGERVSAAARDCDTEQMPQMRGA